jgi:hypothetical protein
VRWEKVITSFELKLVKLRISFFIQVIMMHNIVIDLSVHTQLDLASILKSSQFYSSTNKVTATGGVLVSAVHNIPKTPLQARSEAGLVAPL